MAQASSKKWLITINNPVDHGFDHARIKAAILDIPNVVYWCLCDEQGDECETLHTHVYFYCSATVTHSQVDARFPSFHRDIARGKSSENRAYVLKDGEKFNKQPDGSYSYKDTGGHVHEGINFSDTFEEGGEMPQEQQGKSRDADKIVELIKSGATNEDIVDAVASAFRDLEKVERVRSIKLLSSALALLLMLTVNAYAAAPDGTSTTGGIPEDIPEWALKPAIEPDEDPTGTDTDTDTDTEQGYTTIYDTDGSILYTDDPALQGLVKNTPVPHDAETDTGLFLTKPFDEYTVTEGMLLLFLVLGFILVLWRLVKGVF